MKGFRSFVLQDLPYVLPSKGIQAQLLSNCQLVSSHIHSSAASRRFWNLFEFAAKEETCREANNCPPKDIAASATIASTDLEGTSKNASSSLSYPQTVTFGSKNYNYLFDLKSTPMSCMKVTQPLQQDNLMSLLDGNPVPKTLKWKLKGYRTLRNEQDGDFAFIPGAKSNDYDILSRNESTGPTNTTKPIAQVAERTEHLKSETSDIVNETTTTNMTNETVEHREELPENITKTETAEVNPSAKDIPKIDQEPLNKSYETLEDSKASVVCSGQKAPTLPKLLAGSIPMKEDIKFLPLIKSELSSNQLKYQTQPAAQYSSRPPKKFTKPSAPVLKQTTGAKSPSDAGQLAPPMESYQENHTVEAKQPTLETLPQRQTAAREETEREWSTMEPQQDSNRYMEQQQQQQRNYQDLDQKAPQLHTNPNIVDQEKPLPLSEPLEKPYIEDPADMEPRQIAENESRASNRQQYDQNQPDAYFAPRSNKYAGQNATQNEERPNYEALVGLPPRNHPVLNITHPGSQQRVRSSPCAASHARLQQVGTGSGAGSSQPGSYGGNNSPMSGQSGGHGGGSKKPPGSLPPFAVRRSSSNSSCLLKKITVPRDAEDASRRGVNSVNPSSNISTSSATRAPRRCDDDDVASRGMDSRCSRSRTSCKPQRPKCEQERPKCKKERKPCKRYCCPALKARRDCDFSKYQCPDDCPIAPPIKAMRDPSCLPEKRQESLDICTAPPKRKRSQRSCKRERPCKQERPCRQERSCGQERAGGQGRSCAQQRSCGQERQRSCDREERSCQRRTCKRQEPMCPPPDKGREICTKPRKRDNSCKRERKCGERANNRSAKCSGRRHYTHAAYVYRINSLGNVKRFSSLPTFPVSYMRTRNGMQSKYRLETVVSESNRFYGKETKPPTCKDSKPPGCKQSKPPACKETKSSTCKNDFKSNTRCKKEEKKEDPCKKAKEDPCKKASQTSCGQPKKDTCGKQKTKSEDFCAKRREELCKERKKAAAKSEGESSKERVERERKEMEECKKGSKSKSDKGKKKATGLERVISPCKQKQSKDKGSKCKFTPLDVPYNLFTNTMSTSAMRQDSHKFMLPNTSCDRSYSTSMIDQDFEAVSDTESYGNANMYSYHDDRFNIDEMVMPTPIVEHDEIPYDHGSYSPNWLFSWFGGNQD